MSAIHFCIDMQTGQLAALPPFARDSVKRNNLDLIAELETRGVSTVYLAYVNQQVGSMLPAAVQFCRELSLAATTVMDYYPALKIDMPLSPFSLIGFKNSCSAYEQDKIVGYVEANGYSHIILSGLYEARDDIKGSCVSETACDFARAGKQVTIVAEATNLGAIALGRRQKLHRPYNVAVTPMAQVMDDLDAAYFDNALRARDPSRLPALQFG